MQLFALFRAFRRSSLKAVNADQLLNLVNKPQNQSTTGVENQ
jgi:hypothetical protein